MLTSNLLSIPHILLLQGIIALAYFIRGISGFGSGLIAIPLLALSLPLPLVVPTVAMLDNVAAAGHGVQHRQGIVWRELLPLLPVTLLGVATGLYLLQHLDTKLLQQGMGGFLLLYALYMLSGLLPQRRRPLALALPFGMVGGLVSTLLGTGGPFYVIYLHLRGYGRVPFRATVAAVFLLDGAIRMLGYLFSGLLDSDLLIAVAVSLPVMLGALKLGGLLHQHISQQGMQRLISLLLLGSAVALLAR